jgi:hypothetical protein
MATPDQLYEEQWQRYHELQPDVEAVEPTTR